MKLYAEHEVAIEAKGLGVPMGCTTGKIQGWTSEGMASLLQLHWAAARLSSRHSPLMPDMVRLCTPVRVVAANAVGMTGLGYMRIYYFILSIQVEAGWTGLPQIMQKDPVAAGAMILAAVVCHVGCFDIFILLSVTKVIK